MSKSFSDDLVKALDKIDRPGTFCASGSAALVLPGLEVTGLGPIGLPLSKTQAMALKEVCRQAPYGKGEQTLVDTDVRRVWQVDAKRLKLTNPDWQAFLQTAVAAVQVQLGLEDQKLEPHLYNLLLYEQGSFFKSHRDGEKLDRMVATLVVVLPSEHAGGELVVRHEGAEQVIRDDEPARQFRLQFAAFYADCEHEIKPLRSGFRLCLIYNLTLARSRGKSGISAPRTDVHTSEVAGILGKWPAGGSPQKLAVLLGHEYTLPGLVVSALKGVDRVKARVLFDAAEQAGCHAHLALLTLWQSGSAEGDCDEGYGYNRRQHYDEEDDEDDGDSRSGSHYSMGELYESSLMAEHWSDADGNVISFGEVPIDAAEVVPQGALDAVDPEENFEGYTGNAGMTLERWYRHAAIVLWPARRHFDVLCGAGHEAALAGLEKLIAGGRKSGKQRWQELRPQCLDFARRIIARWPKREFARFDHEADGPHALPVIAALDDAPLIAEFLRGPMQRDASLSSSGALSAIGSQHGWQTFQEDLAAIFEATTQATLLRNIEILEDLCVDSDDGDERRALCLALATRMFPHLKSIDKKLDLNDWRWAEVDRSKIVASLVKSLVSVEPPVKKGIGRIAASDSRESILAHYLEHIAGNPKRYSLSDVQLPAVWSLQAWLVRKERIGCPPLRNWLEGCLGELQSRADNPPQKPADWRRPATLSCKCSLCTELAQFLKNREEQVHRFSVKKESRKHLHQIIVSDGCDLNHETDRRGSPQTLVCTKNYASFEKAVKAHAEDQANLTRLKRLLGNNCAP